MSEKDTTEPSKTAGAASVLTAGLGVELDEDAVNEACWAFLDGWNKHTDQSMSGNTWNNLKPMVRAAIEKYITYTTPNAKLSEEAR
jgi:hypothetical protein